MLSTMMMTKCCHHTAVTPPPYAAICSNGVAKAAGPEGKSRTPWLKNGKTDGRESSTVTGKEPAWHCARAHC